METSKVRDWFAAALTKAQTSDFRWARFNIGPRVAQTRVYEKITPDIGILSIQFDTCAACPAAGDNCPEDENWNSFEHARYFVTPVQWLGDYPAVDQNGDGDIFLAAPTDWMIYSVGDTKLNAKFDQEQFTDTYNAIRSDIGAGLISIETADGIGVDGSTAHDWGDLFEPVIPDLRDFFSRMFGLDD